jgi:hypothetical protein
MKWIRRVTGRQHYTLRVVVECNDEKTMAEALEAIKKAFQKPVPTNYG